mmetsp:Transcript_13464/g.38710  ORF Transcript_13464/g.38710 Transcript_13464/m.38710 type:complete len:246 (+) Transcript_13464:773-1510(+)
MMSSVMLSCDVAGVHGGGGGVERALEDRGRWGRDGLGCGREADGMGQRRAGSVHLGGRVGDVLTQVGRREGVAGGSVGRGGLQLDDALESGGVLGLEDVHLPLELRDALPVALARSSRALAVAHPAGLLPPLAELLAVHGDTGMVPRLLLDARRVGLGTAGGGRVFVGLEHRGVVAAGIVARAGSLGCDGSFLILAVRVLGGALLLELADASLAGGGGSARRNGGVVGRHLRIVLFDAIVLAWLG